MPPIFAPDNAVSLPLHVVAKEGLTAWLAMLIGPAAAWATETGFAAGAGEVVLLPDSAGKMCGAAIGLGDATARVRARFTVAKAVAALPGGVWHLDGLTKAEDRAEAALGWLLATYRFDRYKTAGTAKAQLKTPEGVDATRLETIAAGEFLTRDLINTPASDMGPAELEDAFAALADRFGASWRATRGDDLLAANFPMIHAVGRAAATAPRLLDLRWGDRGPRLTLVGKGVCFDTGGLDIKPAAGMLLMKKDMGGAATVIGLAQMIMALALPVHLRVLVPAVENSIAGNAMRPGDILTSRKGLTVEVNNTDAEGRLVLADALTLADEETPDLIVSMATLTGAARVAVGPDLAPFYTDDDDHAAALSAAGMEVRDPVWRMPFWAPYDSLIEPGIADLDNAPAGGMAGSITAALFLRRFVEATPYMHFDIYGHQPTEAPARPKGGVGQGARALLQALPAMLKL